MPRGLDGGRARVGDALLARRGVRDAGVRDDRLRLRELEMLARHDDRRRQQAVRREHRRTGRGHERAHEREVAPAALADAAVRRRSATKPLAAVTLITSTPASRRPSVSSRPSARFAFCTAWPAAPLPRLSIAQIDDGVARRAVLEDADLGIVGVLDARELGHDALRQDAHDVAVGIRVLEQRAQRPRSVGCT